MFFVRYLAKDELYISPQSRFFACFFFIPFIIFALLFLSLLVVTQIRGYISGSFLLPTTVRALHFYRDKISARSSLVDSRLIDLIVLRAN